MFINMIALGRLLKYLGINIDDIDLESLLPHMFMKENLEAIRYGYTYRDHLDGINERR